MHLSTIILGFLGLSSSVSAYIYQPPIRGDVKRVLGRRTGAAPATPGVEELVRRASSPFLNSKSSKFAVNSTGLPDVDFDIGESYAGLLPISDAKNETRELFFWFFPSTNPDAKNEITIWFNGGPGCSSLVGFLEENGPFLWQPGTYGPVKNAYSWTNLTNMVWIEQPVGVGYTQGKPDIVDEIGLSKQFTGFWKNFVSTFNLQHYGVYMTGESYGGYYVPYLANAFIEEKDNVNYNMKGIMINDPIIGDGTLHQLIPVVPLVEYWSSQFYLNNTLFDSVKEQSAKCGFDAYREKTLTFPPPTPFPIPPLDNATTEAELGACDVFNAVYYAESLINPCFNIYHLTDQCPTLYDPLGQILDAYEPPGSQVYFDRPDVQKALHVPPTNWTECSNGVFIGPNGDTSLGPAQNGILANVIEHTNNVIIAVGNQDFLLPTNGTLLTIQNVTWHGKQGLQQSPFQRDLFVPYHPDPNLASLSGAGIAGKFGTERGFTFVSVELSGHQMPEFAPGAAYRIIEKLLGRIKSLDQRGDFTTQTGNFTA